MNLKSSLTPVIARQSLFYLISSLELDLRHFISLHLVPHYPDLSFLPEDVLKKLHERAVNQHSDGLHGTFSPTELLQFLDLAPEIEALQSNHKLIPDYLAAQVHPLSQHLHVLAPIRNRVMHSRPLEPDDFFNVLAIFETHILNGKHTWPNLSKAASDLLTNPANVINIPLPKPTTSRVLTNLPTPDFDETGFLGRTKDVSNIIKHCKGTYPVISIIGEGGAGKTATALKVAYDLLDDDTCPFDAIVWVSAKTTRLTNTELTRIEGAISTSLGIISSLHESLVGGTTDDPESEIIAYLSAFPILLILDNLETVLDEKIRSFLERLPSGSKVMITSRIGIGSLEFPYRLTPLNDSEGARLLRAVAQSRNTELLVKAAEATLKKASHHLSNNPGFIKWFVSVVQTGRSPQDALTHTHLFLDFCMRNIYEHVSEDARLLLSVMLTDTAPQTTASLVFFSGLIAPKVQTGLLELLSTSMVERLSDRRGPNALEVTYAITSLARQYLKKVAPPASDLQKDIRYKRNQLKREEERFNSRDSRSLTQSNEHIDVRSQNDVIVARILMQALKGASSLSGDELTTLLNQAKSLAPDYFEVYRVEAYILMTQGQIGSAQEAYEFAIEQEPDSAALRYWYAGFLLRYGDSVEAEAEFMHALSLNPDNPDILMEAARAKLFLRRFDEASQLYKQAVESEDLTSFRRRKLYDLSLLIPQRKAEALLESRMYEEALQSIELVRIAYEEIPDLRVDEKMKTRLVDAYRLLRQIRRNSTNLTAESEELFSWFLSALAVPEDIETTPGTQDNIPSTGAEKGVIDSLKETFGFIVSESGLRVFFHYSSCRDHVHRQALRVGAKVSFDFGRNHEGVCAVNVSLDDDVPSLWSGSVPVL